METTEENNQMIAEFMGLNVEGSMVLMPFSNKNIYRNSDYHCWARTFGENVDGDPTVNGYIIGMEYHTSWDWLMPLVEKIEWGLEEQFYIKDLKIADSCDYLSSVYYAGYDSGKPFEIMWENYASSKLEAMYIAVVQFIKWYNKKQA